MTIINADDLPHLGPEFDAESWDFLQSTYPRWAEMLEQEIEEGKTPELIYKVCIRRLPHHRHDTICQRLLMAARFLYLEKQRNR
ncbi:hypothetical protein LCGC14_1439820 [marine sediment metagenome]|uniref:Uncharacterized protein n=1 Tax=marine sediment metagenome TaxID=412755 RepID=A0A0F9K768_9ZZZZ